MISNEIVHWQSNIDVQWQNIELRWNSGDENWEIEQFLSLTLIVLETSLYTFANSVNPDQRAI